MLNIPVTIKALCLTTVTLVCLILGGCNQQPQQSRPEKVTTLSLSDKVDNALSLAASSISPQRELHQLQAVTILAAASQDKKALNILQQIDAQALLAKDFASYSLLYADLALADDQFFIARQLLSNSRVESLLPQLSLEQQQKWYQLQGELFALTGEDKKSLSALVSLSELASTPEERQQAHEKIWAVLTHLPQNKIEQLAENESNRTLLGWYALAKKSRINQGDLRLQLDSIAEWKENWPNHPAIMTPPLILSSMQQMAANIPQQIAVLLPLQGSLAQAGKAIQNGFLAALYEARSHNGSTPRVRFYDTSATAHIPQLYQQAVADGAQLIIGPVEKSQVEQLLNLPVLPVPTIALNYLEQPNVVPPANFYQFGLSTTDEAKQIADRAWIEGQRSALAITPNSNWGERTLAAFRERWQEKGGILIESTPYGTAQADFTPLLKPALQINQSEIREKRLRQILQRNLSFTPRRRQDIDMVFMVAYPNHARQIKPTLDFLFASDLTVYGTSHLYTGEEDAGRNRDLEGVRFSAMPWTLPGGGNNKITPINDFPPLYRHIFALGLDAYHLHQWLQQMTLQPTTQLFGSTGTLRLDSSGAIVRQQPWAVFRDGKVQSAQQLTLE